MDYVSLEELKAFLRITDEMDDDFLPLAITAASRAVDNHTCRTFDFVEDQERVFEVNSYGVCVIDDLVTLTDIDTDYDYTLYPRNATPKTRIQFTSAIPTTVSITGDWGYAAVPDAVKQATLMQASRFMARRDSPFGVAGSPDAGNELRLLARVDPDVAVILDAYKRKWWAV